MNIDKRFYDLASHLWRGGKYAYYWTPDDGGEKITYWLTVSGDVDVPKMFGGKDTYFSVHPSIIRRSEHERARIEDVAAINGFYCEFDCPTPEAKEAAAKKIKAWKIPAACVIDSGGGYHVYCLLKSPFILDTDEKRQRAIDLQWAFAQWAGGDTSVNDLARVLRVPGTYNHKEKYGDDKPLVSIVEWDMTQQYDIADLETLLQPIIDKRDAAKAHTLHNMSSTVSLSDQELLNALFRSRNGSQYQALWHGDMSSAGNDHSKADQILCNGLAWVTGRDTARMDSLFRQSGLYRDKWEVNNYRERTLNNAASTAQTVYTPGHVDQDAVDAANSAIGLGSQPSQNGASAPTMQTMDHYLLKLGANDEGNAQATFALHGNDFVYCDAYGYLHYNGRFWESDGAEAELTRHIVHTLQKRAILGIQHNQDILVRASKPSASNVRNCLYLFKSLVTVSVERFDSDPMLLNCNNGVVNLKTGALLAHSPQQRFTYCVPVDYDPHADYVPWVEFLARVVSSPEMVDYLQMAVGYTATGFTREECMFYIYGPSRSGKGTFSETLLSILPKPLGVQADFSTFTAERKGDMQNFDLAPLKPARFVVASESNKYDTLNESKIKTATGGDWIRCAFKHRDHFEYRPQFKIWLVSNHPIKGDVDDDAFWGRAKVIEFPHSFLGKEDKTLKQRMRKPEILRGVLRWMVDGAIAWFASDSGLVTPDAVTNATEATRRDLDFVQQWLDECCIADSQTTTINADIRASYETWCKAEGIQPKGATHLMRSIAKKGYAVGVYTKTPLGKNARGVQGLKII